MKKFDSTWIFAAVVAMALGSSLIFVKMSSQPAPAAHAMAAMGEFPADWFASSTDQEHTEQAKLVGKPMPALDLSQWRNGEVKPDDMKGKVVFLDFWATWCAPCIASFPDNSALYAKYKPQGLEAIGICTSAPQTDYAKILDSKKPTYPMARDENLNTAKTWTAQTFPIYAIVDRKGVVRAIGLKHEYVEKVIEKLLAEPAP